MRLKLEMDCSTLPSARHHRSIPGSEFPDEWILYGNHHDAWVQRRARPISGAAALYRNRPGAGGETHKQGWRPKRTILFAFWTREEFGLTAYRMTPRNTPMS